jgi:hypothetical protein
LDIYCLERDRFALVILSQTANGIKDRATYRGAMDHADNKAKVRSAVGLTVEAGWVMDVVDAIGGSWDGNPDRFTYPTLDKLPVCRHFAKAS